MKDAPLHTCVSPAGRFVFGLHEPHYRALNLRAQDAIAALGQTERGEAHTNAANFPAGDVEETGAQPVFEIPNAFPFRGATYIGKAWADRSAESPERISIGAGPRVSLIDAVRRAFGNQSSADMLVDHCFNNLPPALGVAVALLSGDPEDLMRLARQAVAFTFDPQDGKPTGMVYEADERGRVRPRITDAQLFEAVANNPYLPDDYKRAMVLRPGAQGNSEIVGEWRRDGSHIYEYLRRNSYIAWGHYAANMADDAVRYAVGDLTSADISGLRHLYYQRTYVRLAEMLQLTAVPRRRELSAAELEALRGDILSALQARADDIPLPFSATLWGWNYGFDYTPRGYRLNASHQQIHQQYALIPTTLAATSGEEMSGLCRRRHDPRFHPGV